MSQKQCKVVVEETLSNEHICFLCFRPCLYDPIYPVRDERLDRFDVLKYVTRLKQNFTPPVKK